jgi:Spy/CpxP family protein refolding chaperone
VKRVSAVLAVLSVLALGVIVGILGTHLFYAKKLRQPGSLSETAGDFFARRLERELGLSEDQRRQIETILAESRVEGRALREEMRPRVTQMMERTSRRIQEVLTPEQRELFGELQKRHRGRAERFLLGPPGGPGYRPGMGPRRGPGPGGPPPWREPPPPAEERPEEGESPSAADG